MFFTLPRTTMALAILHDIVLFSQIFHVFFFFVQLSSLRFSLLSMSKGENSLPVCLVVLENRGSKPRETWHFTSSKTQHDRSVFLFTTFPLLYLSRYFPLSALSSHVSPLRFSTFSPLWLLWLCSTCVVVGLPSVSSWTPAPADTGLSVAVTRQPANRPAFRKPKMPGVHFCSGRFSAASSFL